MSRRSRRPGDPDKSSRPAARPAPPPGPAAPPRRPARSFRRRALGFVLRWSLVVALWLTIGVGGMLGWYALQLPRIDQLEEAARRPTVTVEAADGSMLAN